MPEMVDADRADGSRLLTGPTGFVDSMGWNDQGFQFLAPAPRSWVRAGEGWRSLALAGGAI